MSNLLGDTERKPTTPFRKLLSHISRVFTGFPHHVCLRFELISYDISMCRDQKVYMLWNKYGSQHRYILLYYGLKLLFITQSPTQLCATLCSETSKLIC